MRGAVCAALLVACAASAQAQNAGVPRLTGRVFDQSTGEAVANAEVRLLGIDTTRVVTDARGEFRTTRAGAYDVVVRALGYRVWRSPAAGLDAQLMIGLTPLPLALDRVVVTAAKREQKLADVVVTTEVLSRADIARTGASDLAGALSSSTGVQLDAGIAGGVGPMLQGLGSARVLVLLDGQPMPGRIGGEFDFSRIPTSVIERVEIVKGPQSTLYGSDAMGGVVNVITRAPDPERRTAGASVVAGSNSRHDGSVSLGAARGSLSTRADLGHRSIETTPGRPEALGAFAERLDGALSLTWRHDASTVETSFLALDERQRFLAGGIYNFADNEQVTARVRADLSPADWSGRRVRASVYGSGYDHLSRASTLPQPIRGDTGQRQAQRLFQAELSTTAPLGRHVLDLGGQFRVDDAESVRVPGGRRSITTIEPLAQLDAAVTPRLSVVSGLRVSSSSRWGTRTTPRVALRYRPNGALTLRASAGAGFRAPDFRELYMRFVNQSAGYAVYGNENLRPERSLNLSVGGEWVTDAGFARAQLFWNDFRDFIETRAVGGPGEPPLYEYGNIDNGFTRGLELESGASVRGLRVDGGYALLRTGDRRTGQPLLGRATHSARASLSHPLPLRMRASAIGVFTGRTPMGRDANGAVTSWREAYARLDVRLARRIAPGTEVTLSADNAFDQRPRNWAGYTGRQLFVALSWESR